METQYASVGFSHFISQSDFIGKSLLLILIAMSVISWSLIILKSITTLRRNYHSHLFLQFFWNAVSLDEVKNEIMTHGVRCPFSHLAAHAQYARDHHANYGASKLAEAGTQQEFVIRTMRKVIDEDAAKLENGLSALATIGATAPFVGLFGTVWGIYHALAAISISGVATLDKVAGPVGEALIMTGVGLAVAIPSVIAYNTLVRSNTVTLSKLEAFAYELLTFLSMGKICSLEKDEMPISKKSSFIGVVHG